MLRHIDVILYVKHNGVIEVEQALPKPESATHHFSASVVNYIPVGTMTNFNIAQASADSNQNINEF